MKLNISRLRELETEETTHSTVLLAKPFFRQLLDIVECAKLGLEKYDLCEGGVLDPSMSVGQYDEEVKKLKDSREKFRKLLEDVEMGDE